MVWLTMFGAVATAVLVWAEWQHSPVRLGAKPLASAAFLAVAVAAGATSSAYGGWVLTALALSALGDVALLSRASRAFVIGLAAFLAAHVAYIGAFWARGIDGPVLVATTAGLFVIAGAVIRWLLPHVPGSLQKPVIAYAAVISLMVAAATATVTGGLDMRVLVAAGGFYVSDLAVARDRFVAPGFVNRLWGLPFYYGAQFLFAWTV